MTLFRISFLGDISVKIYNRLEKLFMTWFQELAHMEGRGSVTLTHTQSDKYDVQITVNLVLDN